MKKKLLSVTLVITMLLSMLTTMGVTASAAEYTSGLYTYTLSGNQATITKVDDSISGAVTLPSSIMGYTVVGIGQSVFENHNSIKSVTIPNSITDIGYYAFRGCSSLTAVTIGNGLTTIPYYGFQGCTSLETLKIGANVTQIDAYAFEGCTALNDITWGSSLKSIGGSAFSGCIALTTVSIPNTVTTIGDSAFSDCSSITALTIGSKVTTIGNSAFYGCSGLKSASIPNSVTEMGAYAFKGCTRLTNLTIGSGLTTIPYYGFQGCTNLETLKIGANVTQIDAYAFESCTALNSITWGSSLKSIGGSAFSSCTALTTVSIPNTVTTIGDAAFYDCSSITALTIGSKVTTIGNSAFYGCNGLKTVSIPDSVTEMGAYAFKGCTRLTNLTIGSGLTTIPYYGFQGCTSLETLKIGANVTQIDSYAFSGCTALNNITWGSSLKNIGNSAFSGCTALTTVSIPNTVTTIGDAAFYDCSSITSLTMGSKVTTIGNSAFYGCSSLKSVVIPEKVTTIGNYAFEYCTGLKKVYFPENLQTIAYYAFNGCLNITDVYYAGNESDWKYVSIESGNDPLTNSNVTYHYNYGADVTNPTGSISSTNNVSTSQTVTLTLSDNVGVAGYYWGTSSIYGNNTYTSTSGTRIDKTILTSGTYYLTVKDTSGNLSATYSITFYKTTLNANGGTVSPSYVITKSGNSIILPTPIQSGANFVGWGVSASSTSGIKSITPVENKTYYAIWEKIPATVSSISIQSKPTKTVYTVGEKFDASGLAVKVTMSDGTTKTITSGFTLSNPDMSTAGTKTVTVTYSGKTTSFTITINNLPATVSSISIQSEPTKMVYTVGEKFDASGLKIKVTMSDGTAKTITSGFTLSNPDMSTAGTKTVTVSYSGKTTTFTITVKTATTGTLRAEVSNRAVLGQTVDIPIYVDCNAALGTIKFHVQYDKTKLQYVSCNENAFKNSVVNDNDPGKLVVAYVTDGSVPAGKICVLRFKVIASSAGNTNLNFSAIEATDSVDAPINMSGGSYTLPLVQRYTVTYNANGGTGAPAAQTKYTGDSLKLSSVKPTRTGYTFLGWATSATATSAQYAAGGTYTGNANLTLYAVWKANTYTVTYNANGGTGTTASSSHTYDTAKALTANGFTRTGYTFLGWSTSASATTATYTNKQSVKNLTATNGGTVTLYAVWQKNPSTVSSISIQSKPTKTVYTVGEKFDASGLAVKVTMSDGTTKTITSGFTLSNPDMSTAGTKTVTVTYSGKTASFTITVNNPPATVSSIAIQSKPTKTVYTVGEKFDASGLAVKVTMSDGTTKTITSGFTLSNPDMSKAGTKSVTVTYSGKTVSFTITVKDANPPANTGALRLITPASARVGQRVQIPVQLDKALLGTLTFTVKYDHTKLKYVSCTESTFDMCDVYSGNTGVIRAACIDNGAVSAGRIAVLTFEVIAPSACLTDLTLTVEEAYDGSDKAVSVTGGTWKLSVVKTVLGDLNGDGQVTAIDARWALQAASGTRTLNEEQKAAADINGDGKITAIDARWILQAASGTRVL